MTRRWMVDAECPHGATHQVYLEPGAVFRAPRRCECNDLQEEAALQDAPMRFSRLKLWRETRRLRKARVEDFLFG